LRQTMAAKTTSKSDPTFLVRWRGSTQSWQLGANGVKPGCFGGVRGRLFTGLGRLGRVDPHSLYIWVLIFYQHTLRLWIDPSDPSENAPANTFRGGRKCAGLHIGAPPDNGSPRVRRECSSTLLRRRTAPSSAANRDRNMPAPLLDKALGSGGDVRLARRALVQRLDFSG